MPMNDRVSNVRRVFRYGVDATVGELVLDRVPVCVAKPGARKIRGSHQSVVTCTDYYRIECVRCRPIPLVM
jgi:hypothetical protein